MAATEIQFCNKNPLEDKLAKIVNKYLSTPEKNITDAYEFFRLKFNDHTNKELQKSLWLTNIHELGTYFFIDENAVDIGIDLPTWLNYDDNNEKIKIIIVAQYPLRKSENSHYISLGNPYCLDVKEERNGRVYWKIIQKLLEYNYSIYLTDTFKVFYRYQKNGRNKLSNQQKEFTHPKVDVHQLIFKEETEIVEPDLIVTFGNIPRIWFSPVDYKKGWNFDKLKERLQDSIAPLIKYNNEIPLLPLPHPSGRSSAAIKFFEKQKGKDIACLYADYIKNYLEAILSNKQDENDFKLTEEELEIIEERREKYLKGEGKTYAWEEVKSQLKSKADIGKS